MARDPNRLFSTDQVLVDVLFGKIGELILELTDAAGGLLAEDEQVRRIVGRILKPLAENPAWFQAVRHIMKAAKPAFVAAARRAVPDRIGSIQLSSAVREAVKDVVDDVLDHLAARTEDALSQDALHALVDEGVQRKINPTTTPAAGGTGANMTQTPAGQPAGAAAQESDSKEREAAELRRLRAEMFQIAVEYAADPVASRRFTDMMHRVFEAIQEDRPGEVAAPRQLLEALVSALRTDAEAVFEMLARAASDEEAFELVRGMAFASLESSSTRAQAGDFADRLVDGEDRAAVIGKARELAGGAAKVATVGAKTLAIVAAVLAILILLSGGFGIVMFAIMFLDPGPDGEINIRAAGMSAAALVLTAVLGIILGGLNQVIWDLVEAAADKASDPFQWLGRVIGGTLGRIFGSGVEE